MNLVKVHDSVLARMALADIEMRFASGDGPIGHYLKALELEPGNTLVVNNLAGYLAFHQKNYDDALFWAQKALALAPAARLLMTQSAGLTTFRVNTIGPRRIWKSRPKPRIGPWHAITWPQSGPGRASSFAGGKNTNWL